MASALRRRGGERDAGASGEGLVVESSIELGMTDLHEDQGPALADRSAYNEAERLPATLTRLRSTLAAHHPDHEILMDDGAATPRRRARRRWRRATRGSGSCATAEPGKGYAVRYGAAQRGAWVLFSDADLSTPIESWSTSPPTWARATTW